MPMNLKVLFITILFILFTPSWGQEFHFNFKKTITTKINKIPNAKLLQKTCQYYLNQNIDSTLLYTQKTLNLNPKEKEILNYTYFFRGLALKEKMLYEESKKFFLKINKNFYYYPKVKASLGEIALNKNELIKSINYLQSIEKTPNLSEYNIKLSSIKHNLGIAYLLLKDFSNAEKYLLENTSIQETEKDTINLISSYGDLANLYYEQYKDNQAIPYFEKAYNLAKKTNDFKLKATTSHNMAVVEENRKNYEKANQYRKEHAIWKDSVNDKNKVWEVAQLEKQFAIKEKQKEVSLLQAEKKVKIAERNGLLFSAIILLALLIVSFYFYMEKSKRNRIISKQKEKLDEINATKDKLFSIVSHDLRSSVSALKSSTNKIINHVNESKWEEATSDLKQNSAIANATYNLLDNLLHWALLQNQQTFFEITPIKIHFIVEQVSFNYLSLLKEKNIILENLIPKKACVVADQESLKIILRNLIDNAIKFSNENSFIRFYAEETEQYWRITLEDQGKGMSETIKNELLNDTIQVAKKTNQEIIGSGLGMQLCKSMIQKNHGKLEIESTLGIGTKMIISLPKQHNHG